jgi:hypothetical protein
VEVVVDVDCVGEVVCLLRVGRQGNLWRGVGGGVHVLRCEDWEHPECVMRVYMLRVGLSVRLFHTRPVGPRGILYVCSCRTMVTYVDVGLEIRKGLHCVDGNCCFCSYGRSVCGGLAVVAREVDGARA